jgi:hypothetical protein
VRKWYSADQEKGLILETKEWPWQSGKDTRLNRLCHWCIRDEGRHMEGRWKWQSGRVRRGLGRAQFIRAQREGRKYKNRDDLFLSNLGN